MQALLVDAFPETERGRKAGLEEVKVFGQPAFNLPVPLISLSEEDIVYTPRLL